MNTEINTEVIESTGGSDIVMKLKSVPTDIRNSDDNGYVHVDIIEISQKQFIAGHPDGGYMFNIFLEIENIDKMVELLNNLKNKSK